MRIVTLGQRKLAIQLFEIGAVEFGAFKLKLHQTQPDAPLSPIFFNLRTPDNPKPGPLTPEVMDRVGQVLYARALWGQLRADYVAGIPNAGDPLVEAFCREAEIKNDPFKRLHFEKEVVDGKRRIGRVIGDNHQTGESAILIDDLVTQADTKFEAIKSIEAAGLIVAGILVLIDLEQGGRLQLEEAGYVVSAIYPITDLLAHFVEREKITKAVANDVLAYIKQNQS